MSKKNPLVFLDVSIDGDPAERMVFELFSNAAPVTAENFRALCTGEKGSSKTGKPLHYKGSFFHRIVKGLLVQGGDILNRDGTNGESIYEEKFPDEPLPKLKHDERGMLTMAVSDRKLCGSLFSITFQPNHQLDRKHVVFGKLAQGYEVLEKIENVADEEGLPLVTVKIVDCGEFFDEKKKREKLRGKYGSSELHEVNRVGKRKKSSRHRRRKRRRKYYSSELASSLDSETESSNLDSDSNSDSDSESSFLSSSSDDKRKKRKCSSKRDRYKHQKRRNKKRRKHAKKSKRRSKRVSDRLTDTSSQSESSDDDGAHADGMKQSHKTLSEMIAPKQPSLAVGAVLQEKSTTDIFEKEVKYPSENSELQSNGTDIEAKAVTIADKPDVVDDQPGKSRSRRLSPERSLSKSISHDKILSPRQSIRSPSFDKSPKLASQRSRSISRSPVRDVKRNLSRSPVKFSLVSKRRNSVKPPSRRSISKSPITACAHNSISRSPVSDRGKSLSRNPMRDVKRSLSRSPIRAHARGSYSRSPVSDRGRSVSKSRRDESPKRIRRGRGFSQRFSHARRYRTPSPDRSPVRSSRYGRNDRERYRRSPRYNRSPQRDRTPLRSSPRRYRSTPSPLRRSPRCYRSPPRERTPSRYRSRKGRTRSPLSQSPTRYRAGSRTPPSRSRNPVITRPSPRSPSPKRANSARSSSSSRSPAGNNNKSLVSYDDGSPDFNQS